MWALPLALWAAVPAVRWCPLSWQEVCATALLRCSAASTPAECEAAAAHCPLAREPHADRAEGSDEPCSEAMDCPMAHATPHTSPPHREPNSSHRAYCLGESNGGAGLTSFAPRVHPATPVVAVVPAPQPLARPSSLAQREPQLASRPPPRAWLTQPPARAPPAAPLT